MINAGLSVSVVADELMSVLDRNVRIAPLTSHHEGLDVGTAYAVGEEIVARRRARGEQTVGRKIGFTNRTIWDEYGVREPIWARVYDRTVTFLDSNEGSVRVSHLAQPRIEPEIVLHFHRSPATAQTEAELLECIDWIAHGFEIVQSHYPDWKFQPADTIAAFGLHGALVIGPPRPVGGFTNLIGALRTFKIDLACCGDGRASGGGFNVLDSPLLAASHFLALLASQPGSEPVAADEVVTTGTLTAALPIQPGEVWTTHISGLDVPGLTLHVEL